MLSALLRRIFSRKGFRASILDRQTLVYKENGRKMTVAGEMLKDGFEVYCASVLAWDGGGGLLLEESERRRIVNNIRTSLESQGARVVLS
jgi:hypothetical protein